MFSSLATDPQEPYYFHNILVAMPDLLAYVSSKLNLSDAEFNAWRDRAVRSEDRIMARTINEGVHLLARLDPFAPEVGPERELYVEAFSRADFDRMFRDTSSYWTAEAVEGRAQAPSRRDAGARVAYAKIKFRGVIWQLSRETPR